MNNKFEFRPSHVGTNCSVIGMVVYQGFGTIGNGLYAPVYQPHKKVEMHRVLPATISPTLIKSVSPAINSALQSLIVNGAKFEVRFVERYKTNSEKDAFGKHSENSVGDITYSTIKDMDEEGEIEYNSPESFNHYVINYINEKK